ncbi:MAG: DUF4249 domain-containing protein [Chitinophagales bacterium]
MKCFGIACFLSILISSCEKSISFNLDKSDSQLVVDASIESNKAPIVILSKSLDYFSEISPDILSSSFIHGAKVVISSDSTNSTLTEYSIPPDSNGYTVFYYTVDSSLGPNAFLGVIGKHYSLSISVNNQQYSAESSIPALSKKIDSLWWIKAPDNPDTTKVVLKARVTDPPGLGNYIRYFTNVDGGPFFPGLNSVFDDQIVDGTTYDVDVDKGVNRNQSIDLENYAFFNRGDTVGVRFCNIDKATFDFWRTMEYNYQSIGNPFSSPTKVLGNISNGALGYFGGYAAQYVYLIIPK